MPERSNLHTFRVFMDKEMRRILERNRQEVTSGWKELHDSSPITGLDKPLELLRLKLPEFLDNWHMKVARLSALYTGCITPQENSLDIVQPEGSRQ
jgi:hypothetical protein